MCRLLLLLQHGYSSELSTKHLVDRIINKAEDLPNAKDSYRSLAFIPKKFTEGLGDAALVVRVDGIDIYITGLFSIEPVINVAY